MAQPSTHHQTLISVLSGDYDSRTGSAAPTHLQRVKQLWRELETAALCEEPSERPAAICARVAPCAGALLEARAQVGARLAALQHAPRAEPELVDHLLAHFVGLTASEYFTACLLTLSIEADRARATRSLIPKPLATRVVEALERHAMGASVAVYPNFERSIFRCIPFQTALRIVGVTNAPHTRTGLLDEIYPHSTEGPGILLTKHANLRNATGWVASTEPQEIVEWIQAAPAGAPKDQATRLIVEALVELERLHEIPECLALMDCPQKRTAAAAAAALNLAQRGAVFGARLLLEHVDDLQSRIPCEVAILVSNLSTNQNLTAAVETIERIEHELVGPRVELLREWYERRPVLETGPITTRTMRALSDGWRFIGEQFLDAGCVTEALETVHKIPSFSTREGLWMRILEKIPPFTTPEETLQFCELAVEQCERRAHRESEVRLLDTLVPFLAGSGNPLLLNRAFELIEEKFADSSPSAREERRNEAIAVFLGTPQTLLATSRADALCAKISNARQRGETQYLLALWAVFYGNKTLCEKRLSDAEESLHAAALEEATYPSNSLGSLKPRDAGTPKTSLPDFIEHLHAANPSTLEESEAARWFTKTASMALGLQSHPACGIFVAAIRLMETPPFPSRTTLFERLLSRLRDLHSHAPQHKRFPAMIRSHFEEKRGDASNADLMAVFDSIDWASSSWDNTQTAPTPESEEFSVREAFDCLLAPFSRGFETDRFLKDFLQASVSKVLRTGDGPVLEAFFDATKRLASEKDQLAVTQSVLLFAREAHTAASVQTTAERFAQERGFLAQVRESVEAEYHHRAWRSAVSPEKPFEEEIAEMDFHTAFQRVAALVSALSRQKHLTHLLQRALDAGNHEQFERAFELAEQTFVESASQHCAEFTTWEAKPWFEVIHRIPENRRRLSFLNRSWDWFGLVPYPEKNPLLIAWAEQMASLGYASRALETVRDIPTAEDRALGLFKISLSLGLLDGNQNAAEIFSGIPGAVDEAIQQNDTCFRMLSEASEIFARSGDPVRFDQIHALGRHVLATVHGQLQTSFVLSGLLASLVSAQRADRWIDLIAFASENAFMDPNTFHFLLEELEKMDFARSLHFSSTQRSEAMRHLLAFFKQTEMRPADEAKVFELCACGAPDLLPLKDAFRKWSSCHPHLIPALLGNPWEGFSSKRRRPPALPASELAWVATLCPYSAEAAVAVIEQAVADALRRDDWACIQRIASCSKPMPLKSLQRIAETLLAAPAC